MITERHVQAIWYDPALRPKDLRTVNGTPVRVVEPGTWNLEAGPDFQRACVETNRRIAGDVEVHLRPGDWETHGHATDPAYRGVAVHVTWHKGRAAHLPPGCLEICLGDFLRTRHDFTPGEIDVTAYPYAIPSTRPCADAFRDPDVAAAILWRTGRERLEGKARNMTARFVRVGREQVFYEEMFTALGFKYNGKAFRALAARVPWAALPSDPVAAETAYRCAGEWLEWHTANVRPANTPTKRFAAAAALFAQGPALIPRLLACDLSSRAGQKTAAALLRDGTALGAGRAGAILANALIPFAFAAGVLPEIPEWILPEDISAPVRLTAHALFGRDHNPALYRTNGLLIQGLLHIYRLCLGGCETCPFHPDKTP